ncbi:MAG: FHA domain-containing protein, partial [Planctomycetes bacterium]|nr:FHA domain-containing protein [Planctomycetota bacterium]
MGPAPAEVVVGFDLRQRLLLERELLPRFPGGVPDRQVGVGAHAEVAEGRPLLELAEEAGVVPLLRGDGDRVVEAVEQFARRLRAQPEGERPAPVARPPRRVLLAVEEEQFVGAAMEAERVAAQRVAPLAGDGTARDEAGRAVAGMRPGRPPMEAAITGCDVGIEAGVEGGGEGQRLAQRSDAVARRRNREAKRHDRLRPHGRLLTPSSRRSWTAASGRRTLPRVRGSVNRRLAVRSDQDPLPHMSQDTDDLALAWLEPANGTGTPAKLPLATANSTFGRVPGNTHVLADKTVSRQHAKIFVRDGRHWIADQNSTAGTFVNGQKVTLQTLTDGDEVRLGTTLLRYRLPGSSASAPPAAAPPAAAPAAAPKPP